MKKTITVTVSLLGAFVFMLSSAHAESVSYSSLDFNLSTTDMAAGMLLELPKFDASLGVLETVTLTLNANLGANFHVTNTSNNAHAYTVLIREGSLWMNGPNGEGPIGGEVIDYSAGTPIVGAGETLNLGWHGQMFNTSLDIQPVDYYLGNGSDFFNVNVEGISLLVGMGGGGSVNATVLGTGAYGNAMVTYGYAAVPEPSSAILGLIAGLIFLGQRRRS